MTDDQGDVEQQAEEAVEAADAALAERSRDDLEAAQAELEEALQRQY